MLTISSRNRPPGRSAARTPPLEEDCRAVEPGDARAAQREPVRDPAVPAGQVEHLGARVESEQGPDRLRLAVGAVAAEQRLPEVEVVLAEQRVVGVHGRSLEARRYARTS
jgi:hypothetical protein